MGGLGISSWRRLRKVDDVDVGWGLEVVLMFDWRSTVAGNGLNERPHISHKQNLINRKHDSIKYLLQKIDRSPSNTQKMSPPLTGPPFLLNSFIPIAKVRYWDLTCTLVPLPLNNN